MKLNIAMLAGLLATNGAAHAGVFEQQLGYVCSLSTAPQLAGPAGSGALHFTLSTEPRCRGEHLPINYVCPPDALVGPFTGDYCSADVRFGLADMTRLHQQLLSALESDLPVSVGRERCVKDRNDRGCFFDAAVWNSRPLGRPAKELPRDVN